MNTLELKNYTDEYGPAILGVLIGEHKGSPKVLFVLVNRDQAVIERECAKFGSYVIADKRSVA